MILAAMLVILPLILPIGLGGTIAGHLCLYLGYLLVLIDSKRDGKKFDVAMLMLGILIWFGLVVTGPLVASAMAASIIGLRTP